MGRLERWFEARIWIRVSKCWRFEITDEGWWDGERVGNVLVGGSYWLLMIFKFYVVMRQKFDPSNTFRGL